MGRGKMKCKGGNHMMTPFKVERKKKKRDDEYIEVSEGVRCKWCKISQGGVKRYRKENRPTRDN